MVVVILVGWTQRWSARTSLQDELDTLAEQLQRARLNESTRATRERVHGYPDEIGDWAQLLELLQTGTTLKGSLGPHADDLIAMLLFSMSGEELMAALRDLNESELPRHKLDGLHQSIVRLLSVKSPELLLGVYLDPDERQPFMREGIHFSMVSAFRNWMQENPDAATVWLEKIKEQAVPIRDDFMLQMEAVVIKRMFKMDTAYVRTWLEELSRPDRERLLPSLAYGLENLDEINRFTLLLDEFGLNKIRESSLRSMFSGISSRTDRDEVARLLGQLDVTPEEKLECLKVATGRKNYSSMITLQDTESVYSWAEGVLPGSGYEVLAEELSNSMHNLDDAELPEMMLILDHHLQNGGGDELLRPLVWLMMAKRYYNEIESLLPKIADEGFRNDLKNSLEGVRLK